MTDLPVGAPACASCISISDLRAPCVSNCVDPNCCFFSRRRVESLAETEDVAKPAQEEIITLLEPAGSRSRQRGAIQIIFDDGGNCSGTILNKNMILTAAHCLPQPNRNALYGVTIIYQHPTGDKRWDLAGTGVRHELGGNECQRR